jgi:hypothetical protein
VTAKQAYHKWLRSRSPMLSHKSLWNEAMQDKRIGKIKSVTPRRAVIDDWWVNLAYTERVALKNVPEWLKELP